MSTRKQPVSRTQDPVKAAPRIFGRSKTTRWPGLFYCTDDGDTPPGVHAGGLPAQAVGPPAPRTSDARRGALILGGAPPSIWPRHAVSIVSPRPRPLNPKSPDGWLIGLDARVATPGARTGTTRPRGSLGTQGPSDPNHTPPPHWIGSRPETREDLTPTCPAQYFRPCKARRSAQRVPFRRPP